MIGDTSSVFPLSYWFSGGHHISPCGHIKARLAGHLTKPDQHEQTARTKWSTIGGACVGAAGPVAAGAFNDRSWVKSFAVWLFDVSLYLGKRHWHH